MPEDQNADSTNVPGVALWAPDVLRRVSKNFTKEVTISSSIRLVRNES